MEAQTNDGTIQMPWDTTSDPDLLGLVLLALVLAFIAGRLTVPRQRSERCGSEPRPLPSSSSSRASRPVQTRPVMPTATISAPPIAPLIQAVTSAVRPAPSTQRRSEVGNERTRPRMERTRSTAGGQLPDGVNEFGEID